MNARVLVVDEASRGLALLAVAELSGICEIKVESPGTDADPRVFGDEAPCGIMEFFDWRAKCSFEELVTVWNTYNPDYFITVEDAKAKYDTPGQREDFALAVWHSL